MKFYAVYYVRYSILFHGYLRYVEIVKTDDIYHSIGKIVCNTLERMYNVRYHEICDSPEAYRERLKEYGAERITDYFYRLGKEV